MCEIGNSRTPETYTSSPVSRDLRNRKITLVKAHFLTGCDVTNKIGSKTAAFKACPEKYLYDFGEEFHDYHFQMAEKYLRKVVEPYIAAESFDDLRYVIHLL